MNERSLSIPLEDAAVAILEEAPETWEPIPEDWGDLRTRMFNTLLRSGLVEYLGTIRFTKASGESAIAVIRWKGSGDYVAVLNTEVKKFRPMWAAAHKVSITRQQPELWRITADGEVARFGLSQGLQLVLRERSPCLVIERFTEGASDFGREGSPTLLAAAQATVGDIVINNYVTVPQPAPPVVNVTVAVPPTVGDPPRKIKKEPNKIATQVALLSGLCSHHKYDGTSIGDFEPIAVAELAGMAAVDKGTASRWFKQSFRDGHKGYKRACVNGSLLLNLQLLRGDITPRRLHELNEQAAQNDTDPEE